MSRFQQARVDGLGPGKGPGRFTMWTWLLVACAAGAAVVVAAAIAPHCFVQPWVGYLVGSAIVVAMVLGVGFAAPSRGTAAMAWVAALGLLMQALGQGEGPWVSGAVATALLLLGSAIGAAVGGRISHPGHLLFVAWMAGIVDALSLLHPAGISHAVARSPEVLSWVAISLPLLGTHEIVPFLGGGDIAFVALYLAAGRTHQLQAARTVWALAIGFALAFGTVLWLARAIPVLPYLGAAVLAAHPAARRPPSAERRLALCLVGGLTVVAVALTLRAS